MSALPINKVTNANVYAEGNSLLGKVLEFEVPKIVQKMVDNMPLGQIGTTQHFAGFEPLEGVIKWTSVYDEIYSLIADPFAYKQIQLRANIDVYTSGGLEEQVPCVIYLTCSFAEVPGGVYKAHENVELETPIKATSMKIEINGAEVLEYDAASNIYKVDGEDKLAQYRANLGA